MSAALWVAAAIAAWCALSVALCAALARIGRVLKETPPRPPASRHRAARRPTWARNDNTRRNQ